MTCAKCGAETDALLCRSCREALEDRSRETYQLAEAYHLGTPVAQYAVSRQLLTGNLLIYGISAFLLLAGAIGLVVFALTSHAGLKTLASSRQILAFFGLLAGGDIPGEFLVVAPTRRVGGALCAEGFGDLNGSPRKGFPWGTVGGVVD